MTNDMTKGAITPLLIRFTIPLVLGNLFQLTYNAADSIIVGKFVGEEALAAVGTSNPLMTLAILFINGMCLGAGILVSTAFGAGNTQLMERQVSTTAIAGTVFSLAFSALCVILATPLAAADAGGPPDILAHLSVSYLRIVFAGLIFTFFYNFLAATMRALGDSQECLVFPDDQLCAEHRRRPVLCAGAELGQQRLRPFHRGQRSTVLRAVRTVHPLEGAHPAAGQALAGV